MDNYSCNYLIINKITLQQTTLRQCAKHQPVQKRVGFFAQRGAGGLCGWQHWAKCPFLPPHWLAQSCRFALIGQAKKNERYK